MKKSSKTTSTKGTQWKLPYREDPIIKVLSMATLEECASIAWHDAAAVATNRKLYVDANKFSYYVLINTWILQIRESGERGCLDLLEAINTKGLLPVIAECSALSDALIASGFKQHQVSIPGYLIGVLSQAPNDRKVLQYLRYPKRFSPDGADLLQQKSMAEFLAVNRRCKRYTRDGYPQYWISRIRSRIGDMLSGYNVDWTTGSFSAGVAADAKRPLMEKLFAFSEWCPRLYNDIRFPIGHAPIKGGDFQPKYVVRNTIPTIGLELSPTLDGVSYFTAQVRAVPKSYKASRIIAMEHAYRQFHMQAIRTELERCLEENGYVSMLDLHDQTPNQQLAFEGSIGGGYATIDLSSASDSLSRELAYSVLPIPVCRDIDRFVPRYFSMPNAPKRPILMHMFCTSGSAVTFPIESIVFLAIMLEVQSSAQMLTGQVFLPPQVFGDDLVIDVALYDTAVDVLTQLGFVVNADKSFGAWSHYRESCGVEYFSGYDTSSTYWPRATFHWDEEGIASSIGSLCSLQHRLYDSYSAQRFLVAIVRILEPRMTSHEPGADCSDLWEPVPRFLEATAPIKEGFTAEMLTCDPAYYARERHLALLTRREHRSSQKAATGYTGLQIVEAWRYARFLRFGRSFDTELDRLLGVSSKPPSIASDCDTGRVYWGYTRE